MRYEFFFNVSWFQDNVADEEDMDCLIYFDSELLGDIRGPASASTHRLLLAGVHCSSLAT